MHRALRAHKANICKVPSTQEVLNQSQGLLVAHETQTLGKPLKNSQVRSAPLSIIKRAWSRTVFSVEWFFETFPAFSRWYEEYNIDKVNISLKDSSENVIRFPGYCSELALVYQVVVKRENAEQGRG